MLKRLLLTTAAAVSLGSAPLLAQTDTTTPPPVPPVPAPSDQPADQPATGGASDGGAQTAVTPPPDDVIIPRQSADDMRADKLIGMRVYNLNGDEVGKVDDILFDKEGKITGVVLSVGGVFGIGSKAVGLVWKEVDVSPQQDTVQISYTKQQLESAPEFQRLEPATTEPAPAIPAAGGSPPAQ